jgi:UDP-GlcNAc:undecaprenyl-phosphate GlcNAc-1-phosphate transferase
MTLWMLAAALSFLVSCCGSIWLCRQRFASWQDQPGARSLHSVAVPRLGGVPVWLGIIGGGLLALPEWKSLLDMRMLLSFLLLAVIAIRDDMRSVQPWVRLICQILAALLAVLVADLYLDFEVLPWLWVPVGVLMYLWGINLYNFMDGMDGFAGGMAVIGFGGLGLLGLWQGDIAFAGICSLMVSAHLGFLLLNFPPARLFMGDIGSTLTGFAMVSVGVLGWKRDVYSLWVPLILFSPFWVDATVTLLKRVWLRERVWEAHRQHHYQRWVLAGLGHRRVVLVEYTLMVACLLWVLAWQVCDHRYNEVGLVLPWATVCLAVLLYSERGLRRLNRCTDKKEN